MDINKLKSINSDYDADIEKQKIEILRRQELIKLTEKKQQPIRHSISYLETCIAEKDAIIANVEDKEARKKAIETLI